MSVDHPDNVGIDAIAVYVPKLYVDLTGPWAEQRASELGEESVAKLIGKVTTGVGVRHMAIPDAHEDAATLAAMAAKRVIDQAGIAPSDIDYLAVGTETTVDQSKSIASYVLGMLQRHYEVDLSEVGCPQIQFACIGATYALEAAAARIRAGDNTKPYALVIATDVSKYPLRTPGEYTQGAGAVAMLVCKNPRLAAIEPGLMATFTRDERDFFRPNWLQTAVVDGKYSIDVYLDLVAKAAQRYRERLLARHPGRSVDSLLGYYLFHVPFPRMAEYAAGRVFYDFWAKEQLPELGEDRKVAEKALAKSDVFKRVMQQKVEPSLTLSRTIGNIYSGSLYLALQSLFEQTRDRDLHGERLLLCSYGSGASAKVFSLVVQSRYREGFQPMSGLDKRQALDLPTYERLHARKDESLALLTSARAPSGEFAIKSFGKDPNKDLGYRFYDYVA